MTTRAAALVTAVTAAIAGLVAIRVGAGGDWLERPLQLVLVVAFPLLARYDFRAAVAVALAELAIGGAGGKWTELAGGVSGRHYLDAVVIIAAAVQLAGAARTQGRAVLGRYGLHALVAGAVLTVVWGALGLAQGNARGDVLADANAMLFLGFVLVPLALLARGDGPWLRRCLLLACAANAVVTVLLIALSAGDVVPLYPDLRVALLFDLDLGGVVGYMPNGAYRLFLGSGLYLQVGVALCTWELLRRPRDARLWALYALLWFGVIATYTRGLWLGAALAAVIVVALGAHDLRAPAVLAAGTAALLVLAIAVGAGAGFSVTDYVFDRAASIGSGRGSPTGPDATRGGGPSGEEDGAAEAEAVRRGPKTNRDLAGALSNRIKADQAKALTREIRGRPVLGSGWGAVSERFRYRQTYAYELTYHNLLFKTGALGFLLFLSVPLRLLADSLRGRLGRLELAPGVGPHEAAVPAAVIVSILFVAATNPYLLASFGLAPILWCVAWLQPGRA